MTGAGRSLLILVLDNSDKRLRDEQLLMFEAAQWLQKEFRGLIILPLREETYDNHRGEPPLDTALKDLVFRIEPPLFQKVLQTRVQIALKSIEWKGQKKLRYNLPNGMSVEYSSSDQAFYLASIMRSIFEYDHHVRKLIVGLAGRNIRRALEIFLEFCTSGHIGEDQFLKIKQAQGQHTLPFSLVMTVLLRLNQRYYDSNHAYLKNIVSADERDERPQYFIRIMILRLLKAAKEKSGSNRLRGYVAVRDIANSLFTYGVDIKQLFREIEALAVGLCILSEDFRTIGLAEHDLVAISPAGFVHLEMMSNVYYLAAIAEDTWFQDKESAERITNRIRVIGHHYDAATTLSNALQVVELLTRESRQELMSYNIISTASASLLDMSDMAGGVDAYERTVADPQWIGATKRFPVGTVFDGVIVGVVNYGVFVELAPAIKGLVHVSTFDEKLLSRFDKRKGDIVKVSVLDIDEVRLKASLRFV